MFMPEAKEIVGRDDPVSRLQWAVAVVGTAMQPAQKRTGNWQSAQILWDGRSRHSLYRFAVKATSMIVEDLFDYNKFLHKYVIFWEHIGMTRSDACFFRELCPPGLRSRDFGEDDETRYTAQQLYFTPIVPPKKNCKNLGITIKNYTNFGMKSKDCFIQFKVFASVL